MRRSPREYPKTRYHSIVVRTGLTIVCPAMEINRCISLRNRIHVPQIPDSFRARTSTSSKWLAADSCHCGSSSGSGGDEVSKGLFTLIAFHFLAVFADYFAENILESAAAAFNPQRHQPECIELLEQMGNEFR